MDSAESMGIDKPNGQNRSDALSTLRNKARYGCWPPSFARRGERGVGGVSGGRTGK